MTVIFALLTPIFGRLLAFAGRSALFSGLFGFIGPALTGMFKLVGGIFEAVCEIIVSLSKSPEGRVVLGLATMAVAFLALRFHYIEEGKAMVHPKIVTVTKPCPTARAPVASRKRS